MDANAHPAVLALNAVLQDASNVLRVPIEELHLEFMEAKEWSDGCLGLPAPDEACTDAITPGFLVVLNDGISYRTDRSGNVRRETDTTDRELVITFRQSGGIGGFVSVYHADDSTLSPADAAELREFIDRTDFFHLPETVRNGEPIPDMFNYRIFLAHGRRNHTVGTYDGTGPHESPALDEFIGWLKTRAPEPGPDSRRDAA